MSILPISNQPIQMVIEICFRVESYATMIAAELLIFFMTTKVVLELSIVAIDLSTAKVSADEANLSIDTVKSLHMKSKIAVPGERRV
jgi:hypothetical protein